jgi:hypothetical protein
LNHRRHLARGAAGLAIAVLSLGWLLAPPASAENLSIVIDSPADGRRFERSTVTVAGRVDTALLTSVDHIRVIVSGFGRVVDDEDVCPCEQGSSVPFSHTTTLGINGPYSVRVVASGYLLASGIPVEDAVAERSFTVAVRPAAPSNLRAERLADNKVQLMWGAVPAYPDLIGYLVYRGAPGAQLKPVSTGLSPAVTSYIDDQPAATGGTFHYKVAAIRSGAIPGDTSEWLTAESNLATVNVPPPPSPSTPGLSPPPGSDAPGTTSASPGAALDLGRFFDSTSSDVRRPAPSFPSSAQLPDTGFSTDLPFPNTTIGLTPGTRPNARPSLSVPQGRPSGEDGDLSDSNRRALLVPVAAGSVLCVSALHLRWLSRQLAIAPLPPAADLSPAEPALEPDAELGMSREPVGAGVASGPSPD